MTTLLFTARPGASWGTFTVPKRNDAPTSRLSGNERRISRQALRGRTSHSAFSSHTEFRQVPEVLEVRHSSLLEPYRHALNGRLYCLPKPA